MADKKQSRGDGSSGRFSDNKRGGYVGPEQSKPPTSYQKPAPKPAKTPTTGGAGK